MRPIAVGLNIIFVSSLRGPTGETLCQGDGRRHHSWDIGTSTLRESGALSPAPDLFQDFIWAHGLTDHESLSHLSSDRRWTLKHEPRKS